MKKANKKQVIERKESEKQANQPVDFRASHVVHAPSQQIVEQATEYVEDRFGRALVRLSDR
jgi:hypothetical protein